MYRRTSEYIRSRTSAVLVHETRGLPYKWMSLVLGGFFATCGLRDIFFCGKPFTSDPLEALFLSAFADCQTDIYQEGISGTLGTLLLVVAMLRFHMCFADTTANLYLSMIPLVFVDGMFTFLGLRPGVGKVPPLYMGMVVIGLVYESYVLYLSRRAYLVRLRAKED